MIKYIFVRLIWIVINLLVVISALFIVTNLIMYYHATPFHTLKGDYQFISVRYVDYIKGILTRWDWGNSAKRIPAWDLILQKAPESLKINLLAFLFYIPLSIFLGIISALRKNKATDHIIGILTLIFASLPSFVMVLLLMVIFGYYLGWVPTIHPFKISTTANQLKGLIIPILALSIEPVANLTRLVRGELTEAFEEEYLLLVRTKGLNKRQAIFRHSLKNSMVPVFPALATSFVVVLSNSFFVEVVYNIPGIAMLFLGSLTQPSAAIHSVSIDINVIILICVFYSVISLVTVFLVDLTYRIIDPRIKMGATKLN